MCGIVGIVAPNAQRHIGALEEMVQKIDHRGPDDSGTCCFTNCALGNTRLSIIDVQGGKQPVFNRRETVAVVFNGEIYGYQELRKQLATYPFKTHTDTEILLAMYERYGRSFVRRLPGMFAFALWDDERQELICARDRFGEKPFYFAETDEGLVLGSELNAIVSSGLVDPVLDSEAVSHYLKHMYVHPKQTIYRNVRPLPPGHMLRYRKGRLQIERYWDFPKDHGEISWDDATARFKDLFSKAVKKQLVSDVPVGAFVSGGIDSSTVTAVASRLQSEGVKTFSFGFQEGIDCELPFARQMAARCGTEHIEETDANASIADLLWQLQDVYGEPFADSSSIPTYLISRLARQHVKVVLTGDGADELLGGYMFWARDFLQQTSSPEPAAAEPDGLLRRLMNSLTGRARGDSALARKYYGFRYYFSPDELRDLGCWVDTEHLIDYRRYRSGTLNDVMRYDVESYLCGDILVKTDRASMAHGLELRSPFLDVELAEFCLSLPATLKVDDQREKLLLRSAYQDDWTEDIRNRSKQGFGGPMPEWLGRPDVQSLVEDHLRNPQAKLFDLLSFDAVARYIDQRDQQTWNLLILALWMEKHSFRYA